MLQRDEWLALDDDKAIDRLYKHHRGIWDSRAAMGTLVHAVNEAWTWGEEVDIAEQVVALSTRPKSPVRSWQGREHFVVSDAEPYIDGLKRFWLDWQPVTIATEEVVRHPDKVNPYIGQRDWVCDLHGERWLLDIKTTAEKDQEKGLYLDSWRLQLAAYRHAEEIVLYDDEGNEVESRPNYPVAHCGVIHLRGDGQYALYELQAGGGEFTRFLQARGLWAWVNRDSKKPAPILRSASETEAAA